MNGDFFITNNSSKFIEISGKDRSIFLQGLITNDIYKCKVNNPIYSCILSPQGKFLADFFIIQLSDKYLIEISDKFFNTFIEKINIYKLRSSVNLTSVENIISIVVFSNKNFKINEEIVNFKDPRNKFIGQKIYYKKNTKNKINLKEEKFYIYKEILMKNLVPYSPDDLNHGKSLLLENNFEKLNAIDWDKGCYVGQEITARMKYRALLKKQIYVLKLISGKIQDGEKIIVKNVEAGEVISKINQYLLCMLKIEIVNEIKQNEGDLKTDKSVILKLL